MRIGGETIECLLGKASTKNVKYFLRSLVNIRQPRICPYCGTANLEKIDSKYVVTSLLRCKGCHFCFRLSDLVEA